MPVSRLPLLKRALEHTVSEREWQVRFLPADVVIRCAEQQTLLEAAKEQGLSVRSACRNGICDICVAEYVSGSLAFDSDRGRTVLEQNNQVLCCHAKPLSDIEIVMSSVKGANQIAQQTLAFQIQSVEAHSGQVYRVILTAPAGKAIEFWPGQYLMLHVRNAEGEPMQLPYSIASAPGSWTGADVRQLELHIADASETAHRVIEQLRTEPVVTVTLPMGDCIITPEQLQHEPPEAIVMIAAGTGFAQIKSLAEGVLARRPEQEVHIYWSNREADGFYLPELPVQWAEQYEHLHYHPIIEQGSEGWQGRAGWIYQVIGHDFTDLSHCLVYACGSPNMVYGTLDQLEPIGLTQQNMRSDVFAYAPRPAKN